MIVDLFNSDCDNAHVGRSFLCRIISLFLQPKSTNSNMSSVDKMKKLLSPGTRKKGLGSGNKTFGVPLEELMTRPENTGTVPYVVRKICEHIRDKGK